MNERIKLLRKALELNQTDFGARIGVKQGTVAAYESGARVPLDSVIVSICREFGVSESWLRSGEGGQEALEKLLGKNHPSIKKTPMSIQMLIGGQVDALVGDETSVKSIQAQYPEAHLSIVYDDEAFTPEFFGILYPKDTGAELKSKIDKALKDMIADGTYGKIYEKWFKTKVDEETLGKLGKR